MVGAMIQHFHKEPIDQNFLEQSLGDERVSILLTPADGLLLEKVDYYSYNEYKTEKKAKIELTC
jgi:tRNA U38,U39,U40 pseudouridine synthase TruA